MNNKNVTSIIFERNCSLKIYTVRVKKIEKNIFDELLTFISYEEKERILRFKKFEDAIRGLTSKLLIRYIIVSMLRMENSSICISKNEYGKPYLTGVDDFHFNLSHSGDWVVCAVDNMPIGIDIEKIHDVDLGLSKRFFSEEEHKYLISFDDIIKRRESFFEIWTLKESYIKADGRGLAIPLNSFSFTINDGKITLKTANQFNECYFKQYNIDNSYKLAVCSKNVDFPENLDNIDFEDLCFLAKKYLN